MEEKLIDKLKRRSSTPDRQKDKGVVNSETGSSVTINKQGNVTIAASNNVQYKMNYASGLAREISLQSDTITNRKRIKADEIVVNQHKLNPQFYELTDMKELYYDPNYAIGNLTINSTVLVKSWEPNLEKWVLIRRPIRTPLFFNELDLPRAPQDMDLDDDITKEISQIAKEDEE